MDAGLLLFRLLALLVAARLAAELAERLRMPAVLVEISAGVLLGPSLFGFIGHQEPLHFLGELGAMLLLLEVGLHMDLGDLRRVGGSALKVAVIGIAAPMALALFALRGIGIDGQVGLFLAAGITATSVGITARVFADMRALATTEAQTVLGAAVADDVIGLLILTVVVRLSVTGSIDVGSIAVIAITGIAFVIAAAAVGAWLAPRLFDRLVALARTDGALIGAAVAFTLAFAGLASVARLAPIVGAFVAGISLGRIKEQEELRERLAPVTHLFVPVFFLLIGAEAHISAFADRRTLVIVAVLGVVAVVGKLVAGWGAQRGRGDRVAIGVGMIPRGEVGVVFATLGLSSGVLGTREHAALLFVVLATTVISPPWLRRRIERGRSIASEGDANLEPHGGWLLMKDGEVELAGDPPDVLAARIGMEAAHLCRDHRPGARLLDWLGRTPAGPERWDDDLRRRFLHLLRDPDPRSWRLLDVTGVLRSLLPEIDAAVRRHKQDAFDLDPAGAMRWRDVEALNGAVTSPHLAPIWGKVDQEAVLVAALGRSAFRGADAPVAARRLAETLGLDGEQQDTVGFLVAERDLLPAAASRILMGREEAVMSIASHVGSRQRADALYLLAVATSTEPTHREALSELHVLVDAVLAHPGHSGSDRIDIAEARKRTVIERLGNAALTRVLEAAPHRYLITHEAPTIARHVRMLETPLAKDEVRIQAEPRPSSRTWTVHVVTHDRQRSLTAIARAFTSCGIPIEEAWISTWKNGVAVAVFTASAGPDADWDQVRRTAQNLLTDETRNGEEPIDAIIDIDNVASPWYTIVELRADDRAGLLYRAADAFARAGITIDAATVSTDNNVAFDTFVVTDRQGHKLGPRAERALRLAFEGRSSGRWAKRPLMRRALR